MVIDNRLLKHKDYCHFIMIILKSQSVIVGGKKVGKVERRILLTKEEIKALCEEAADKAVERSEKAKRKRIAQEKKTLLYNTKKLLENYTKLKDYAEKAVCTIDEADWNNVK